MNLPVPSRRTMLGALGSAALASIIPWKPKAHDIVIATELPPLPEPVKAERVVEPLPDFTPGAMLYDKLGREVAVVTHAQIDYERVDAFTTGDFSHSIRWQFPGEVHGTLQAEMLPPYLIREPHLNRVLKVPTRTRASIAALS